MRMVPALVLLSSLLSVPAVPSRRPACSRRALGDLRCHDIPQENLRQIQAGLRDHFWAGQGCEEICYCLQGELLCCPKGIFFGPKISFVIPCNDQ
ncbi:scrapie-responsive protein 1 [Rissa tridactyla]|uniref:scrapie-responsive protein 1 n=1 Tax=Rissa tridactyla TaxID=75485 RepID=UPI0023BAF1B3|nr:scrapie-responsive protein 1 [Rissa tridactyla]